MVAVAAAMKIHRSRSAAGGAEPRAGGVAGKAMGHGGAVSPVGLENTVVFLHLPRRDSSQHVDLLWRTVAAELAAIAIAGDDVVSVAAVLRGALVGRTKVARAGKLESVIHFNGKLR